VEEIIRPALKAGKWVICDRFTDATLVYQGAARGQDMEMIRALNDKVTQGLRPDITFLVDCPEEMGLKRATARISRDSAGDQDRFEREEMAFHGKVRQAYLDLARMESKRFIVIDGTMPKEDVTGEILRHLVPHMMQAKGMK